jgi:hypothetical protein
MGILSNTISFCQFRVVGEMPAGDLYEWMAERLAKHGFRPIDEGTAELSVGWVHLDDPRLSDFSFPRSFWRDHYVALTLRQDKRVIPSALLRAHLRLAEDDFLAANRNYARVPKQKREELREAVRAKLLAKILPVPATYDAVWDTRSNVLTLGALGGKTLELFETHFRKSFDGLRLVALHPYDRALHVAGEPLLQALEQANRAQSDAVLDLVKSNLWIGTDFLLWASYRTMNGTTRHSVNQPGPQETGGRFDAFLDDRFVLTVTGEHGLQKITASGPQGDLREVRMAIKNGKQITEATIHMEQGENRWKMTLKGELFSFGSFRGPRVTEERDNTVDRESELEALFFERMHIIESGLQLFDSLFASFLSVRLGPAWGEELNRIFSSMEEG